MSRGTRYAKLLVRKKTVAEQVAEDDYEDFLEAVRSQVCISEKVGYDEKKTNEKKSDDDSSSGGADDYEEFLAFARSDCSFSERSFTKESESDRAEEAEEEIDNGQSFFQKSSNFINGYVYAESDYSAYNDPMENRSKERDFPRRLRGGFLLYKDFFKGIKLEEVYEEVAKCYHTGDELSSNSAFQSLLEKLNCQEENMECFAEKLRVFVKLDWATSEDMHTRDLLSKVKLRKRAGEPAAVYEVQIPRGTAVPAALSVGIHVDVRSSADEDIYAGAVVDMVDAKAMKVVLFFLELDRLPILLGSSNTVDIVNNPSAFVFRSLIRSINFVQDRGMSNFVFPSLKFNEKFESFVTKRRKALEKIVFTEKDDFNFEQKNAIVSILKNANVPYPFLLFGPPGTGKTVTLVEAVRQLILASRHNRILVCTPSKMAADNFAETLLNKGLVHPKHIFRMYSLSASTVGRNKKMDKISYMPHEGRNRFYGTPERENLKLFRVVICTLSTSSYLISAGGLRGYFTHIIIDEAGQATEADTWVPIGGLADEKTSVVLAGDPKQLGPVIHLKFLKKFGNEESMLKRLAYNDVYRSADERSYVLLRNTYRSHELILLPISFMFYDKMLKPNLEDKQLHKFCEWQGLPTKGFPLIFHSSAKSKEERGTGGNTSSSNSVEANIVVGYVNDLIASAGVEEKNIGVISPYKNQVLKLRAALRKHPQVTVDSVEGYQGCEREVIIISTVRTDHLGFLSCDLRLNTSISRAKCLLIVVGNDDLLVRHLNWHRFIYYCKSNGGYVDSNGMHQKAN